MEPIKVGKAIKINLSTKWYGNPGHEINFFFVKEPSQIWLLIRTPVHSIVRVSRQLAS